MHRTVHVLAQNGGKQMATRPSVDPVQRARTKLGYKNKWHRYNVDLSNQIRWQQPLQDEPVGIIGGGISGLACAQVCRPCYVAVQQIIMTCMLI